MVLQLHQPPPVTISDALWWDAGQRTLHTHVGPCCRTSHQPHLCNPPDYIYNRCFGYQVSYQLPLTLICHTESSVNFFLCPSPSFLSYQTDPATLYACHYPCPPEILYQLAFWQMQWEGEEMRTKPDTTPTLSWFPFPKPNRQLGSCEASRFLPTAWPKPTCLHSPTGWHCAWNTPEGGLCGGGWIMLQCNEYMPNMSLDLRSTMQLLCVPWRSWLGVQNGPFHGVFHLSP